MKRTGPTNPTLQRLVGELRKQSTEQSVSLWKRLASDLEKPTRKRRSVNLSRIGRVTKENEVIVVPGKVLGSGDVNHKLTISAFQFSDSARQKLEESGSKIVPLDELIRENPSGKRIRIIG